MEMKITEVFVRGDFFKSSYTHRVEFSKDVDIKVCDWLNVNKIPHTRIGHNIFYLNKENAGWLLMRWG